MPGFLVLLFWVWLAISVGVYLFRLVTTGSLRGSAKDTPPEPEPEERYAAFESQLAAMQAAEDAAMPELADSGPTVAPGFEAFSPAPPVTAPIDEPAPMPMPEPTPEPVMVDEPAPLMANPSPIATMATPPMPGDAVRALTLAEALEGIEMPADLIPVATDRFDPRHMQFFTDEHAPGDVGAALADELERLGFTIAPIDDTAIRVEQAHAAVEVRILPDRSSVIGALGERGESLPDAAVVVDFQLS